MSVILSRSSALILRRTFTSSTHTAFSNLYDAIIVGGGIAGATLACALASSPTTRHCRIGLVEAADLTRVRNWTPVTNEYSNRVSSLTPASVRFLKGIGAWDRIAIDRTRPYSNMQVWDGISGAKITFDTEYLAISPSSEENAIAWMVENLNIQKSVLARLDGYRAEGAKVDIFEGRKVEKIELKQRTEDESLKEDAFDLSDWPCVQLDNGESLQTRLLIGADGINSPVRSYANIESLGWDYDTHAVVATLELDTSIPNSTAWQRFLPTGPIAMLPLSNGYSSLVWSTTPSYARALKALSPTAFCALVNIAFRHSFQDIKFLHSQIDPTTQQAMLDFTDEFKWRENVACEGRNKNDLLKRDGGLPPLVRGVQEGTRASFPLRMRNAERYVKERVALVGDAAHAIHPLAGQGLNQGIADVQSLTSVLSDAITDGEDWGNIHALSRYSSDRYLPNLVMLGTVDKLHRLFGTDFEPVVWTRSLGLKGVDSLLPLKAEIMKFAMGTEDMPMQKGSSGERAGISTSSKPLEDMRPQGHSI